jgi:phosphate transport system permease protein
MKDISEQNIGDSAANVDPSSVEQLEGTPKADTEEVGIERATEINTAGAAAVVPEPPSRNIGDRIYHISVRLAVWIFLAILAGIGVVLVWQSTPILQQEGLSFFTTSTWNPPDNVFGAAPIIIDTLIVAALAMAIAGIVGLSGAIYVVDYAPRWLREPVSFLIELLAYIPSVVYGLWGLLVMVPWLQKNVEPWMRQNLKFLPFFNGPAYGPGLLAASLLLSIMLVPLILSLSREALLLVPGSQREAMLALGATRWEVLRQAVIPYARIGIFGAIILALGRALGETIAVAMVIGGAHNVPKSLFDQGYTLSSVIANEFGEVSNDLYRSALITAGLLLFIITALVNIAAYFLLQHMNRTMSRA